MTRITLIAALASLCMNASTMAWTTPSSVIRSNWSASQARRITSKLSMALDYNDPVVGKEFAEVQTMSFEEIVEECEGFGIPVPPALDDVNAQLMLVEIRLRMSGRLSETKTSEKKIPPKTFSSKFDEAYWTKPAFQKMVDGYREQRDINAMNLISEYIDDRVTALERYEGADYKALMRKIDDALNAKVEITSPKISFSGFPSSMGEDAVQMTFDQLGTIVNFECTENLEDAIFSGKVEFDDVDAAEKAFDQYDGMDMGVGPMLEIVLNA